MNNYKTIKMSRITTIQQLESAIGVNTDFSILYALSLSQLDDYVDSSVLLYNIIIDNRSNKNEKN